MSTKMLIFDRNPLELVGLKLLFDAKEIELRAETSLDKEKIKSSIVEWKPDIVLFDVNSCEELVDMVTIDIKRRLEITKIIWLVLEDDEAIKYDAISAGADGCVLKENFDEIREAVKAVLDNDVFFSRKLLAKFARDICMVVDHLGRKVSKLTDREKSVMQLIRLGETNDEIARELYISVETVKAHVRKIRATLGVLNRRQMICGLRSARTNDAPQPLVEVDNNGSQTKSTKSINPKLASA